jgi:hypothetical protein
MAKRIREKKDEVELEVDNTNVTADVIPVYKWKKIGGGSLRMPNRIIKPNQTFEATESEIPRSFMKSLVNLGVAGERVAKFVPLEEEKLLERTQSYTLHYRGNNWYDIVDRQGKALNEKALRKEDAEHLLKSL